MPDQQTGELTALEAKACVYRAQGKSKPEAYRLTFTKRKSNDKTLGELASRLFQKPQIQARVRDLLASVKAADIITIGESMVELLDFKQMAIEDRAHAALANYKRMELQVLGALKDNLALTVEGRADDKALLDKLAGKDKAKLALAREMLGAEDTFEVGAGEQHKAKVSQAKTGEQGGKQWMPKWSEPSQAFKAGTGKEIDPPLTLGEAERGVADPWKTRQVTGEQAKSGKASKAGMGGEDTQPCVDAKTPDPVVRLVVEREEAKDTFDV